LISSLVAGTNARRAAAERSGEWGIFQVGFEPRADLATVRATV
jgi:hypothetical protein